MKLFDTHCHLDFDDFDCDRNDVIKAAKQHGVNDILVPGVAQNRWFKTIELCEQHEHCHLAIGLHPIFIEQHQPQHLNELDELIETHKPVAVGEIGLDHYKGDNNKANHYASHENIEKQNVFFAKQLIIAKQHDLPVIIHNRKAHDLCISMLNEYGTNKGIIHAFNGSIQQAHKYIELGFVLGFGGMLTFERSRKLRTLAKQIPIESIVLETDAPDMTVSKFSGQRNSPEYIPYILESLAMVKKMSKEDVAAITTETAKRVLTA